MTPAASTLWRSLETTLFASENTAKDWSNTLDYGVKVTKEDIDSLVTEKSGGFEKPIRFTNGTKQYKCKAMPVQNKNTREKNAYGSVKGGGENKVNIVAWPHEGGANVFNLHVQVRVHKITVTTTDASGWSTKSKK